MPGCLCTWNTRCDGCDWYLYKMPRNRERFEKRTKMKYIKQCLIILVISLIGELLKYLLPLPIPASIYGMVLLFVGLMTRLIKLEAVKETGTFLIEIMPLMFIPAGVGLMTSWGTLKAIIIPVSIITVLTIVTVMIATGRVSQAIIRKSKGNKK